MEELTGFVEHIIYRNPDNGYTVLELIADEETITCVGIFPVVGEGENLCLKGEYTTHPSYGDQFKVKSYDVVAPADEIAMERYLGSGAIKGIGVKLAARIVRKFGADTFRIIEEEPERLAEVKGISESKAMEIADQIVGEKDIRNAMIFLDKYGIRSNMAIKIYSQFGNEIYNILQTNPYRLSDEVAGIGFKTADEIAQRVGINVDSEFRVKSGIEYVLSQGAGAGHTFLPEEMLEDYAVELLGVERETVSAQLMNLIVERRIIVKKDENGLKQIYSRAFFRMEESIAVMLHDLNLKYHVDAKDLEHTIESIEKEEGMELDELQRQAVRDAATHGLFIMTGGPGTGKTTTIKAMIHLFERQGYEIYLAAPTGRAAKRMSEACGHESRTIHRMLGVAG
ncbi:MAG: AAA family ATPase, partial [Pseudobutyrivibrio sp.]|nr:AAA family ATPase [Pseudobutyrivibrio sp.]